MSDDDEVLGLGNEIELHEMVAVMPPTLVPCDEIAGHLLRARGNWLTKAGSILSDRERKIALAAWDSAIAMVATTAEQYGGFDGDSDREL
jgi:cystathionine beta-lyase family protein involved in aluminum resistance